MRRAPFVFPLLASLALAQGLPLTVSPAAAAAGLGDTSSDIPFSWSPCTYQQVHSASEFSLAAPMPIGLLRLRMAAGFANQPGSTVELELFMADSPHDASTANGTFSRNVVPGTEVNVFTRKSVQLPQVPDNRWAVAFPFDTQFAWAGGHLSWRVENYANGNNSAAFRYPLDTWSNLGVTAANGAFAGCRGSRSTQTPAQFGAVGPPGGGASFTGRSFDPSGGLPAVLLFGLSNTTLGGRPLLPFDLTAVGAPGCVLVQDAFGTAFGSTAATADGDVRIGVAVPPDPALSGTGFFTQFVFVDRAANALGAFLSPGLAHTVGRQRGVTRIWALARPNSIFGYADERMALATGLN